MRLTFMSSTPYVKIVIVDQTTGRAFDPTLGPTPPNTTPGGWVQLPTDGTVPPPCVITPTPLAKAGPYRRVFCWLSDLDPYQFTEADAIVHASDAVGTLGDVIDLYPLNYTSAVPYTAGSWRVR